MDEADGGSRHVSLGGLRERGGQDKRPDSSAHLGREVSPGE